MDWINYGFPTTRLKPQPFNGRPSRKTTPSFQCIMCTDQKRVAMHEQVNTFIKPERLYSHLFPTYVQPWLHYKSKMHNLGGHT
jgi:hypothetical protein